MVDFNKRLAGGKATAKPLIPAEIYEKADRESDTGPLRPSQLSVLDEWYTQRRTVRDVIIKMHTGQGKTLIGLLILQSKLNEQAGPALYICPNIYLVQQTVAQGKRFGIPCATAERDLPDSFTESEQILVTTVHKLFNGLSKFGVGAHSQKVGALVMDDCHACIDVIHQGLKITLPRSHGAYDQLVALFRSDLKAQGRGSFAELEQGEYGSFLPVPYWAWTAHHGAVATILAKHLKTDEVKYAWPLIKDNLQHCTCIISGLYRIAIVLKYVDGFVGVEGGKTKVHGNPIREASIPGSAPVGEDTYAYSADEVAGMVAVLPEPAKTAVFLAGCTGLRACEVFALRWEDWKGDYLQIERAVWNGKVGALKTRASRAPVEVIEPLQKQLKDWRWKNNDPKSGYIFSTGNETPLDQTNVVDRQILPALNVCVHCEKTEDEHSEEKHEYERDLSRPQWRGWHAFRRGLATTLHALGENDQTIQNILRHANVKTTQQCYIKSVPVNSKKAMQKFGQVYQTKALRA